jgi:hypothetical protein
VDVLNSQFQKGQLVTFDPSYKSLEDFAYVTCLHDGSKKFALYDRIDLQSFPSWNDFHGDRILVERGTMCIILDVVGYPDRCFQYASKHPDVDLNVYNVLIRGHTIQAFGCDLAASTSQCPSKTTCLTT